MLAKLPMEARLKIIETAQDVIDSSAWCTGALHEVNKKGEERHCAIGALSTAAVQLGYMEPFETSEPSVFDDPYWKDDSEFVEVSSYRPTEKGQLKIVNEYEEISDLMGWTMTEDGINPYSHVYGANDSNGFEEALKIAREYAVKAGH